MENKKVLKKNKILGLALLVQFFLYITQGILLSGGAENMTVYYIGEAATTVFVFVLPVIFYGKLTGYRPFASEKKEKTQREGFFKVNKIILYLFGLAATVTAVNVFGSLSEWILSLFGIVMPENIQMNIVYTLIKSVFLAAFLEEILCRGAVLNALDGYKENGILLSALIFGALHYDLSAFPYAFAAGLVIAFFAKGTGSLLFAVMLHLGQNLVTFGYMLAKERLSERSSDILSVAMFLLFLSLTVVSAIVYIRLEKQRRNTPEKNPEKEKKSFICPEIVFYFVISVIMSALNFAARYL